MNELKSYVDNLELSEGDNSISFPRLVSAEYDYLETTDTDTALLNFKSLQSFAAGVSKQRQEDLLNSLLLAQRAATKAFPEDDRIMDWYQSYFEVLDKLGWVFENKDFTTFKAKTSVFEIENALLEILSTALTGTQLAIAVKTIESLKSLSVDDKRFVAFEKNTHSLQNGSFQLGVATEENDTLAVSAAAFILNTKKNITKILFFNSDRDSTELKFCSTKATLNESVFAKAREIIREKLGDVSNFVAELEI